MHSGWRLAESDIASRPALTVLRNLLSRTDPVLFLILSLILLALYYYFKSSVSFSLNVQ